MSLPPKSVYPLAYDTDYTLLEVYNTSESKLAANNQAWAEEIPIVPAPDLSPEMWADNGFANISGELLYYDSVDRDNNGQVSKLKRCARNLDGSHTKFNAADSFVRGFVVAEHHNLLADAIIAIENVSYDLEDGLDTLDLPVCIDDCGCPDVTFSVITSSLSDPCSGVVLTYSVNIVSGDYQSVTIDFGDGTTSTVLQGVHTYPPGQVVDPVVTVLNDTCVIIQTPTSKTTEKLTEPIPITPPTIPIPEIPAFPPFNNQPIQVPSTTFSLPPIVMPCLQNQPICITIPSFSFPPWFMNFPSFFAGISNFNFNISVETVVIVSIITVISTTINVSVVANIPSIIKVIVPDIPPISFAPIPVFPPINVNFNPIDVNLNANINVVAQVVENIPRVIKIAPTTITVEGMIALPPTITVTFKGAPSIPDVISFGPAPSLQVHWDTPPALSCNCTLNVACPTTTATTGYMGMTYDEYFEDSFETSAQVVPQASELGIPSQITILPPDLPDIQVVHDLPRTIELKVPLIPDIRIIGPERELPKEIRIVADNIPTSIPLTLDAKIPEVIHLDASTVPNVIWLQPVSNFPTTIFVDGSNIPAKIQVVGMPDSIELKHNLPEFIDLRVPENLEIPLVYKGGPVPLTFTPANMTGSDEDAPCFMMVPCRK